MQALADIKRGLSMRNVWIALAKEDIGDYYRRTTLGPLWLLLNYLLLAGTFIVIFDRGGNIEHHTAYVAIGLFVWLYCSDVITRAITLFQREESFITGTPLPISIYILRMTMQMSIRALYAGIGCLALMLFSDIDLDIHLLWSLLGILIIILVTPAIITVAAFAGCWFPDLQFLVANLMRLGLFLTPIFWTYTGGDGIRDVVYSYNPFTWFLEIVRGPVLSNDFPSFAFGFCVSVGIIFWLVALYLIGRFRKEIVFML